MRKSGPPAESSSGWPPISATPCFASTSPLARTRSLNRCHGFLKALRDRPLLRPVHRAKAAALVVDYPTPNDIAEWIKRRATTIRPEAGKAIADAGDLLRGLWGQGDLDEAVSRDLDGILCHFPDAGTATVLARGLLPMPIGKWLTLVDDAHAGRSGEYPSVVDLARQAIGNSPTDERRRADIAAAELHQANADGLLLTHVARHCHRWETLRALLLAADLLQRVRHGALADNELASELRLAMGRLQL